MRRWGAGGVRRRNTGEENKTRHSRNMEEELMGWKGRKKANEGDAVQVMMRASRLGKDSGNRAELIHQTQHRCGGKIRPHEKSREQGTLEYGETRKHVHNTDMTNLMTRLRSQCPVKFCSTWKWKAHTHMMTPLPNKNDKVGRSFRGRWMERKSSIDLSKLMFVTERRYYTHFQVLNFILSHYQKSLHALIVKKEKKKNNCILLLS